MAATTREPSASSSRWFPDTRIVVSGNNARDPSVRRFMRFNLSSLRGVAITTGATSALVGGVPYLLALLVGVAASALPCPMERRVRTRWW
jgi:hypothetical protein